tara:strand:+ start:670 stop:1587 length:918 start_codon:yes stop_codon:yes gene_type:complete
MHNNSKNIIIGSRESLLARKHIDIFENELIKNFSSKIKIHKKFFKTTADRFLNKKISEIGNKGVFSKEIDEALLKFEINLGIHSLKDLPTKLPKGIEIAATLKRENFRDAIVSNNNSNIQDLPKKAIVGTSSIRRSMQIKKIRPDLIIKDVRGNIDSRLKKLEENSYDAIVLAHAGLKRLDVKKSYKTIDPRVILPALGQGAIALVVNVKNIKINKVIRSLNHTQTFLETECERIFLNALDGSCQTPVGGYASLKRINNKDKLAFNFIAFSEDGTRCVRDKVYFNIKNFKSESYELGVKIRKKIK